MLRGRSQLNAKTAACPVRPDHKVGQARTVDQADPDHRDHRASPANHHRKFASLPPRHRADRADLAKQENPVHKARPATRDQLARPAIAAKTDNQADQAHKDHQAHQATLAQTDHEAIQARPLSALQQLPEIPDPPALMDHPDQLVNQARRVTTAPPVPLDRKDHLAPTVDPAKMVLQETKDHPAQTAHAENRVSARNTAPWTAVSSSKTAQDAKTDQFIISFLQSWHTDVGYGERLLLFAVDPPIHLLLLFTYFATKT